MEKMTSLTVPAGVLADLHIVKAQMAKREGQTVRLPEVIRRLIAAYQAADPC
jgi:hypothetical protein